jgi:uncharacterized protein (DUF2235 family)
MAKKLIVLSDGTGNSAAKLFKTNVWKLYEALDLTPSSDQIAAYDDGVGTSRFKPWALLTGAFGFGLKRNVLRMYVFLSRHYHNEIEAQERTTPQGERKALPIPPEIYALGFSRGAFTVRVLAGLVIRQGLVPHASESEMARMALLSYRAYRKQCFKTKTKIEAPFRYIRDAVARFLDRHWRHLDYDPNRKTTNGLPPPSSAGINTGGVKIRFLGVWDTVAAYGMPIEELRVVIDKLIFPLTFTNTQLLDDVRCARHALSIDDERSSFTPVLWDFDALKDLKQVWFAGVHTNVGGGYPDDSLSSAPLTWMVFEAKNNGLQFHQVALDQILARTTPFGKMYDSRAGFGSFYRYQPRMIRCNAAAGDIPVVHESVVFRMATGFQGYAPIALPQTVRVVDKKGEILEFAGFQKAAARRLRPSDEHEVKAHAGEDHKLAEMVASLKPPTTEEVRLIGASILRRRIAYFGTLIPTLALLALPLLGRALPDPEPEPDAEWLAPVSTVYERIDSLAPSYVQPWLDAAARNPILATILALIAIVSYWRGKSLMTAITDRSQKAWNIGKMRASRAQPSLLDRLALRLLGSPAANGAWRFASWKVFPALALLAAAVLIVSAIDRTTFWLQSSLGGICVSPPNVGELPLVQEAQERRVFRTVDPCMATGLRLSRDHRYEISMQIPDGVSWWDQQIEADLTGLKDVGPLETLMMSAGVPLRRHLGAPWFVPIARVGQYGSDEHILTPSDVAGGAKPRRTLTSVIAPRRDGELFLFVNDAYSGLFPLGWIAPETGDWKAKHLYKNNKGTATVTVRRLTSAAK